MKQLLQNLSDGKTFLLDAPSPEVSKNSLVIKSSKSLISPGTERMLVEFGKAGLLQKALQQPDRVLDVINKVKTDGLFTTVEAVRSKLNEPIALGYSNVGVVERIGDGVSDFRQGERVVSNGSHAEYVKVPSTLCAKIPDAVSDEEASFTVVGSIALQGVRLSQPTLGESFVVMGVGLIGLLTVQILRANGCRVLAMDFDEDKLSLAKKFGADIVSLNSSSDPVAEGIAFSRGKGIDGVIITASTNSNDPVSNAAKMLRMRGRIVLVGGSGLQLNRVDFYEKEIRVQVSCSYGPGRYDPSYEDLGHDYPFGFVRWTEQRNFQAVLDLLASGLLDVKPLITGRFDFLECSAAFDSLLADKGSIGIVLEYQDGSRNLSDVGELPKAQTLSKSPRSEMAGNDCVVAVIGSGNYASRVLIPEFVKTDVTLDSLVTSGGVGAAIHGKKIGFQKRLSDSRKVFECADVNTVVIATRHDSHAELTQSSISAGKNVFVEKPLALTLDELDSIEDVYRNSSEPHLMIGFNRRFSPLSIKVKELLEKNSAPKTFVMTVNAGAIPKDHWVQDNIVGGGRIIGEACHFVDLMRFFVGAKITSVYARSIAPGNYEEVAEDKAVLVLSFNDGSVGTINYFANGSSKFAKETIQVFSNGGILEIDNFRKLKSYGWPGFSGMKLWKQDKGQSNCVKAFVDSVNSRSNCPIAVEEIFEVSRATIEAANQIRLQLN